MTEGSSIIEIQHPQKNDTLKVNLKRALNDAKQWRRSKGKIEQTVLSNKVINPIFDQERN